MVELGRAVEEGVAEVGVAEEVVVAGPVVEQ